MKNFLKKIQEYWYLTGILWAFLYAHLKEIIGLIGIGTIITIASLFCC
jgi:hypothetical protein